MQTSQIVTPKSFYVQERDRLYSSPQQAFWRELGQNAIDAGAKNIHITIGHARGKGAFGREALRDEVIRITFVDDGHGMTADVIDNVYFRPGESTKRGLDAIGGFGRARLLTNFGQLRHRLWTLDSFVDGDGPEYIHRPFADMSKVFWNRADELQAEFDLSGDEALLPRISELRHDGEFAGLLADTGRVKGCAIEVDMDPLEYGPDSYKNPTLDSLMKHLTEYLSMSQLPAKVFINGEQFTGQLLRGPARRQLTATLGDGSVRTIGTLHTNRSEKAAHKRRLIVRVNGATMFDIRIRGDIQVVLELDPAHARDVMTANRDGFREPYDEVLEELKSELAVDTKSALDGRKSEQVTIEGRLGRMMAIRPTAAHLLTAQAATDLDDLPATSAPNEPRTHRPMPANAFVLAKSQLEANGYAGIPFALWREFLERVRWGEDTFLSEYGRDQLATRLSNAVAGRSGIEMVRQGIEAMTDEDREYVIGTILGRIAASEEEARRRLEQKLEGLPDIHVHTHGDIKGKLRDAMRRNDPRLWDPATGAGKKPRSILAAWTVCCEVAIQTLLRYHPRAIPHETFEWSPGFIYSAPEEAFRFNEYHEASVREAEYIKTEDDRRYLLINPVDSDGTLRFSPTNSADLQYMAMLAAHEVSHLSSSYHDEDFASLMTSIVARLDLREIESRTKLALASIREIYAKGRVRVQAMDDQQGPRPADRLRANIFPASTVAASVMANPENVGAPSAVRDVYQYALNVDADGTTMVDGELLDTTETAIEREFDPEPHSGLAA